jgi:2-polyprenyl-6-methoxyphenol hydroxylase-like FAD-dependent oxidoreductase
MNASSENSADIIIIGAGLAGTAAACVLGGQGYRVALIDTRPACPPVFKAEKIEPDQAEAFRKFGIFEHLLPKARRIREVQSNYEGRLFRVAPSQEYGMAYCDMVNSLRERLPQTVQFKLGRVVQIANSDDVQRVRLETGEELTARLVVVACGLNAEIPASLDLKRVAVQRNQSVAAGFTIEPANGGAFGFDSLTYYPSSIAIGLDYITFFPVGETMRANLFAFSRADDPWLRRVVQAPGEELRKIAPNLERAVGAYRVAGKVETSLIHLYRTEGDAPPGVVLIGDASQNACPSTGTGVSKVVTDVDVLCFDCVPQWFASGGMAREKMEMFWNNPRKRETDERGLRSAAYRRRARTETSLRWRIHRARLRFGMRFGRFERLSTPQEQQEMMG